MKWTHKKNKKQLEHKKLVRCHPYCVLKKLYLRLKLMTFSYTCRELILYIQKKMTGLKKMTGCCIKIV